MILYLLEKMVAIIKYINIEYQYCHSTNTSKIDTVNRMVSTGIFSQKVKKQWHCNNCKSDF